MATRPFLIWSKYHSAWFRPNAGGYTKFVEAAGVFTKQDIDYHRERRVYMPEALGFINESMVGHAEAMRKLADVLHRLRGGPG